MTIEEWIKAMSRQGTVCQSYMRKISAASNKTEMFRVLCDVNGGSWLFELHAKGVPLPIDQFLKEYRNYVNGKKVVDYPSGYTSKFYCRYGGEIIADTTIVYVLDCEYINVIVPKNHYPTIVLSKGTNARILVEEGARVNVETYGDGRYSAVGYTEHINTAKH